MKILGEENIDQAIENWHNFNTGDELWEFLGWTREEYAKWVETCIEPVE